MSCVRSQRTARRAALFALAGMCALTAGNAGASKPQPSASPQAIIETRQQGFKKIGAAMKTIVDQLKTDAPNQAKMAEAAQAISAGAPQVTQWFPAGSGAESGVDTDALPHIWKDRAKFDSLANRLVAESKSLAATLSGTDLAAARVQAKALAEACSTCHRSFRAD